MTPIMRKPTFCICENKDADQLRGNREADQRFCFRYLDSMIPLLSKSEISSLWPSSVAVQPGLCRTRSETRMLVFSRRGSYVHVFISLVTRRCLRYLTTVGVGICLQQFISCTREIIFIFCEGHQNNLLVTMVFEDLGGRSES